MIVVGAGGGAPVWFFYIRHRSFGFRDITSPSFSRSFYVWVLEPLSISLEVWALQISCLVGLPRARKWPLIGFNVQPSQGVGHGLVSGVIASWVSDMSLYMVTCH